MTKKGAARQGRKADRLRRRLEPRRQGLMDEDPRRGASSASDPTTERNSRQPLVAPKPEEPVITDGHHGALNIRETAPGRSEATDTLEQTGES
jgi:hypothetical protein